MWAQCQRLGQPSYWRNGGGKPTGGEPLQVAGLGEGRWRVRLYKQGGWRPGGNPTLFDDELEVDGMGEHDLQVEIK